MAKMVEMWDGNALLQFVAVVAADSLVSTHEGRIMDGKTQADAIQQLAAKAFAELGATGPMIGTILLKDGYFVGHRFRCGGMQAVRLAGGDNIEFYDQAGELVKTVGVEAVDGQRAA